MKEHFEAILTAIGEDINREGLQKTPERAANSFKHLTRGYHEPLDELVNEAIFESDNDEMVIVKDIEFYSLCEHHLLPFSGRAHVGYIPTGKVIGLSKVARIVDHFAKRLQIQEQLTVQIAKTLNELVQAEGVAVVMEAEHFCMKMRGVEKQAATMSTSAMLGCFRNEPECRAEFLSLIK